MPLKDLLPGTQVQWYDFTDFGGSLYFSAAGIALGPRVWRTDGTAAGTAWIADDWPETTSMHVPFLVPGEGGLLLSLEFFSPEWVPE